MAKIYIINRQCAFSAVSVNKARPPWFSREKCLKSILNEIAGHANVDYRCVYDNARGPVSNHFVSKMVAPERIHQLTEGTEAGAFLRTLDYIASLTPDDNDIICVLEDDHLMRPNWLTALVEGIELLDDVDKFRNNGFCCLLDYGDKYTKMYSGLWSEIFATKSCHWRITPSTVQSFACRYKTLKQSDEVHRYYSTGTDISRDHEKFVTLGKIGLPLISPIPSFSAHIAVGLLPPVIDWEWVNEKLTHEAGDTKL